MEQTASDVTSTFISYPRSSDSDNNLKEGQKFMVNEDDEGAQENEIFEEVLELPVDNAEDTKQDITGFFSPSSFVTSSIMSV